MNLYRLFCQNVLSYANKQTGSVCIGYNGLIYLLFHTNPFCL